MADVNQRVNSSPTRIPAEIESPEDFFRLREDFSDHPSIPRLVASSSLVPSIEFPGQKAQVLVSGEESSGRIVVFEIVLEPGFGAPQHYQPNEDEFWYILEGTFDLQIGNQKARVTAGAFAFSPRGCTHSFLNVGTTRGRILTMNNPAGHERFFEAVARLSEIDSDNVRRKLLVDHDVVFHDNMVLDRP